MLCDVCPWWLAYTFDNRVRRWIHKPDRIFEKYAKPGMTVLDLGCGMGFSALPLARIVGDGGRVIAVDIQRKMLDVLEKRAAKAGLGRRIRPLRCLAGSIGVETPVDFAVAFRMVHEVPDALGFLRQVRSCLKPSARFLVAEPVVHVSARAFGKLLAAAGDAGLKLEEEPGIRWSRTAVFSRTQLAPAGAPTGALAAFRSRMLYWALPSVALENQ